MVQTIDTESTKTTWLDYLPTVIEDGPKFEGTDVSIANLFSFLDSGWNLYAFLKRFPEVSWEQALEAIEAKVNTDIAKVMHSDKRRVSGTPVFRGTRLPIKSLFDHLTAGYNVEAFVHQFETADKDQSLVLLKAAWYIMEKKAYEAAAR